MYLAGARLRDTLLICVELDITEAAPYVGIRCVLETLSRGESTLY